MHIRINIQQTRRAIQVRHAAEKREKGGLAKHFCYPRLRSRPTRRTFDLEDRIQTSVAFNFLVSDCRDVGQLAHLVRCEKLHSFGSDANNLCDSLAKRLEALVRLHREEDRLILSLDSDMPNRNRRGGKSGVSCAIHRWTF